MLLLKNHIFSDVKIPYQQLSNFSQFHQKTWYKALISWTYLLKKTKQKVHSYSTCTLRGVNLNRFEKKRPCYYVLIKFLLNTSLFETHCLIYKKLNSFVHVFLADCQYFQINPSGYVLLSWKLAGFIKHEQYLSKHRFSGTCRCALN